MLLGYYIPYSSFYPKFQASWLYRPYRILHSLFFFLSEISSFVTVQALSDTTFPILLFIRNFKLRDCTGLIGYYIPYSSFYPKFQASWLYRPGCVTDLVGNPEDRFSGVAAQIKHDMADDTMKAHFLWHGHARLCEIIRKIPDGFLKYHKQHRKNIWAATQENRSSVFPTRYATDGHEQAKKMAKHCTFRI